jgi:hypothetical protein
MSQQGPKPLGGLLRGKGRGSILDSLGPAHTTIARYSCQVWRGVVLAEEACMVVGEGCG